MENMFKKMATNSLLFSIGIVASKAIHILMLPLYTNYLSEAEYGVATTGISFITVFSLVGSLSIGVSILRFLNEITEPFIKKRFVGTVMLFAFCSSLLLMLLFLFPLKTLLNEYLFPGIGFYPIVFFTLLVIPLEACFLVYQSVIRTLQLGKKYSFITIFYLLLQVILNLIFIIVLKFEAIGMIMSLLLSNAVFVAYGILDLKRSNLFSFSFDIKLLKKALSYSVPQVPHDLSNTISVYIPKVFLNGVVSYASTGLYTVAMQISSATGLIQSSVNLALRPWFNEQMRLETEGQKNIRNFSEFIFSIFVLFATAISLWSPEVLSIFTSKNYYEAWRLIPILTLANVVSFVYYIYILILMYNLKTNRFVSLLTIGSSIVNVALSFICIQIGGSFGAAIASLGTQMVLSITTVIIVKKQFKVNYGAKKMFLQCILMLLLTYLGLSLNYWFGYEAFSIKPIALKLVVSILASYIFIFKDWKKYRNLFA